MGRSATPIEAVVVVVPVHNEELLLERCLRALQRAVATCSVRCLVRIVLDACDDASRSVAARYGFRLIESGFHAVGAARAAGIANALASVAMDPGRVWIANTDADSAVPENWLTSQLALADRGADIVVGTVRPDFADLSARHRRRWQQTHIPGHPNGHTHGANLGIRASTYLQAGGFAAVAEHEDVHLVDACRTAGARWCASDDAEVLTSGRLVGRTPGGYAGYLREQARSLDAAPELVAEGDQP